jgi:hypothetical protein
MQWQNQNEGLNLWKLTDHKFGGISHNTVKPERCHQKISNETQK